MLDPSAGCCALGRRTQVHLMHLLLTCSWPGADALVCDLLATGQALVSISAVQIITENSCSLVGLCMALESYIITPSLL